MQIDLRTVSIKQQRNTFDHLARRFGDKPASRYQEASYDIQATENLHYRPTWDPDQLIYDASITKIVMADWYALKDPRQYFYNNYTLARARQQETAEANFSFVESRALADMLPDELKQIALDVLVPLRHAAWGANMNNSFISGYGYAAIFTQACMFHAMDNLGIAQYLSRLGLLLGDQEALTEGKTAWLDDEAWQPMRRYIEDCLVVRDPFELFVAQNVALDGLLYPLVYERIVDGHLSSQGASAVAMLCQFMNDWFDETRKWVDAVMKVAAAESEHNRAILQEWTEKWSTRAAAAMLPVVRKALGADAEEVVGEEVAAFKARLKKVGVEI
ncbi:aromatic/alkene monooxygenase hydroxylase subunit beta [Ferribacterium limneticum]|uniref:aromatic/alkene monooxygenase hydroxylase subunit beta n=1 Tax=Ferribacterium limneticum TaxID=76259 RepID=UPI001CFA12B1|nr:aromatic/alkene monooxygenase hydroxylase subunit beta [Ferribacterium limneticum]UCV18184.1 aromatic/alkene monooxygenase hydroxylase subunit beta [Ferribacterium limneticum]